MKFKLVTDLKPKGSQPEAIKKLVDGFKKYERQTLLGITGSGKTFTVANVIAKLQKPAVILAHNKTLAAQLYQELKELFPHNRVEYFVSYFDYYQPESYLPASGTYIEKDSSVNAEIERMRLHAMASLLSRKDVIIVASVSCIYGIGKPDDYYNMSYQLQKGKVLSRQDLIRGLVDMQYQRNDQVLEPGRFRVRGDTIDVIPAYGKEIIRIELFGEEIESISEVHHLNGNVIADLDSVHIFPAKQFVSPDESTKRAIKTIGAELERVLPTLPPLEAHRLEKRTKYDLEMIEQLGYCSGIENYSRHFDGRKSGESPYTILDYFPEDFLFIIDESHQSIPQLHGMYKGDYVRKKNLIENGFRLPSAFDNRPLKFEESEKYFKKVLFVSATPGEYELKTSGQVVEQIIRPTGLLDPSIEVRPTKHQIDNLLEEVQSTIKKGWRVLVTTLTKRMAEDLTDYIAKAGVRVRYLHSEIDTIERSEIIRQLRLKEFDVLVGINLLREGLDIPEVALVAILDADKQGFLRNDKSLIQTTGRAARNSQGRVIMYADKMTDAMKTAIDITMTRRRKQEFYNKKHGITPKTIIKSIKESDVKVRSIKHLAKSDIPKRIVELEAEMQKAAEDLDFEKAIELREMVKQLKSKSQ